MNVKRLLVLLAGLAVLPQLGTAAPCRLIYNVSLPITQPGRYCLARNIATTNGSGLVIRSDNVIVDFAGYKLSTSQVAGSTAVTYGVDASTNQNITIMNGTVQGYIIGVDVGERVPTTNAGNFLVTNMRVEQANAPGFRTVGIYALGANFTITRNTVSNLSGAEAFGLMLYATASTIPSPGKTVVTGNRVDRLTASGGNEATGILIEGGVETVVNDNLITEVYSGGASPNQWQRAEGIRVASFQPRALTEVAGNSVRNATARSNSTGISVNNSDNQVAFVRDSVVSGMATGLSLGGGCVPYYLYNTISGATTPYAIVGTPVPCSLQNIDPGPGNSP